MAVDWLMVGQYAVNAIEWLLIAGLCLLGVCGFVGCVDEWRYRERKRRVRVSSHPASNVVRLHPRSRAYDWADEQDAS